MRNQRFDVAGKPEVVERNGVATQVTCEGDDELLRQVGVLECGAAQRKRTYGRGKLAVGEVEEVRLRNAVEADSNLTKQVSFESSHVDTEHPRGQLANEGEDQIEGFGQGLERKVLDRAVDVCLLSAVGGRRFRDTAPIGESRIRNSVRQNVVQQRTAIGHQRGTKAKPVVVADGQVNRPGARPLSRAKRQHRCCCKRPKTKASHCLAPPWSSYEVNPLPLP